VLKGKSIMSEQITGTGLYPRAGMIARLKVGLPVQNAQTTGPSTAELRLGDILHIDSATKERVQKLRSLDAHLQLAHTVQGLLHGVPPRISPFYSPVSIEFIKLENPYLQKTDIKV
jgi:hypothetical protein